MLNKIMFNLILCHTNSENCSLIVITFLKTGAVANLRGCGKESAAILFWVHIFAVFSMAGWIILFLRILF